MRGARQRRVGVEGGAVDEQRADEGAEEADEERRRPAVEEGGAELVEGDRRDLERLAKGVHEVAEGDELS